MKKRKERELDVDYIGGQNAPLTTEERLSNSSFIKHLKENRDKKARRKKEKKEKQPV